LSGSVAASEVVCGIGRVVGSWGRGVVGSWHQARCGIGWVMPSSESSIAESR
jgi:hypothetical protein